MRVAYVTRCHCRRNSVKSKWDAANLFGLRVNAKDRYESGHENGFEGKYDCGSDVGATRRREG